VEDSSGSEFNENDTGIRARVDVTRRLSEKVRLGVGVAGRCHVSDCNLEFVHQPEMPEPTGLTRAQVTFDELYIHWFREGTNRFDIIMGRLQTRFVLRGGVYAKSLDRNDSNNTRVTWTDGIHATLKGSKGWRSGFVLQRNSCDGTGSIRHGPLDFGDAGASSSYFLGFENTRRWGYVVQRSLDISYLPKSLLKDNAADKRRVDYWGIVGRLAVGWPQESEGFRFRGGLEVGYAPETPTNAGVGLGGIGDTEGFAWNVVLDAMDFLPGHSFGINYGRTGKGWLLSPQYFPDSVLFELRHHWKSVREPMVETRVRWQEAQHRFTDAMQRGSEFDFYIRATWEFGRADTRGL